MSKHLDEVDTLAIRGHTCNLPHKRCSRACSDPHVYKTGSKEVTRVCVLDRTMAAVYSMWV